MSVKINKKEKVAKRFPKLMSTEAGSIVWFFKPCCGTVVKHRAYLTGAYVTNITMQGYSDFEGEVILSNDDE